MQLELGDSPMPVKKEAEGFTEFWAAYPRKEAKKDAFKAWNAAKPSAELQVTILKHVIARATSKAWQDKQFVMLPATFIRGERWTDEVVGVKQQAHAHVCSHPYASFKVEKEFTHKVMGTCGKCGAKATIERPN
jgi:hypothetical protein